MGSNCSKQKKCAEGGALELALEGEIGGESERDQELQQSAAGDAEKSAQITEEQVAAFVDGDEDYDRS